jgi:hypothetical protein
MTMDSYANEIIESLRDNGLASDEELMQIRRYLVA